MNKESLLRWIIYVGAGLLTFTPLLVAGSMYFPFITGKAFFFRIITAAIFAAWTVLAIYYPKYRPRFSPAAAALGALIVVALAASLLGVNPADSLWSNFERMMGWVTLVHLGAAFVALAHTLRESDWRKLFYLSFGSSVITALIAFGEVPETGRVDANLGNAIYLAAYALVHAFLAAYFFVRRVGQRLKRNRLLATDWQLYAFSIVGMLNLLALYFTKTRGAFLGLLAGLGVAAVLVAIFEKKRAWLRFLSMGVVGVAVLSVGLLIGFRDTQFVQNQPLLSRFANISVEEGTVGARLDVWELGLEGYRKNTKTQLAGWGPDNFNYVFNNYYNPELYDEETWFDRAHNVALEWLIAAGPLGLLSYLSLFAAAIWMIWRDPKAEDAEGFSVVEKSVLTGLVVAYLVQNLSVFDHLVSYLMLLWLLGWLHARSSVRPTWLAGQKEMSEAGKAWASTAGVVVILGAGIWVNYPGMAQATTLIDALQQEAAAEQMARADRTGEANERWQRALPIFKKAISYDAMGTQEARERLLSAAEGVVSEQGATSSVAQDYLTAATDAYETQIALEPGDLRHHVFYGQLFMAYGQYDRATQQFETATEIGGGQKQKTLLQLADAQEKAGQTEASLETLKRAHELDTSFARPARIYARALIDAGQGERGQEILEQYEQENAGVETTSIEELVADEEFGQVITILKERISGGTDNPQLYASLAAAQAQAGKDEEAIATLEEAVVKFPQLEDQVNQMIEQIQASNPTRP